MTITISKEWIASLAPDAASLKAGISLANVLKWQNLSKHSKGIWGDCQGSGKTPYQVRIALTDFKIHCTCPSRKRPCKHALGLLTLFSQDVNLFNEQSELPEILLPKTITPKTEEAAAKATVKDDAKKLAAQRKRQAEREKKIADGLEALDVWLNDLARQGLSRLRPRFYQDIAARLVDAQAGGLANLLRGLAEISLQEEGYETHLLQALSQVFLLSQAYRCQDKLSPALREELRRRVGWNVSKETLLHQPAIEDNWLLLSKKYQELDFVTSEQLWFIGEKTARMLLIWNFLADGATPSTLQISQRIAATAHFYPSPWPLRAIFAEKREGQSESVTYHLLSDEAKPFPAIPENQGYSDWQKLLDDFSLALADNPFLDKFPAVIHKASIQMHPEDKTKFFLCDQQQQALPLANNPMVLWRFLAVSRGQPVTAFVLLGNGDAFLQSLFTPAQAFSPESSFLEI